MPRIHIASDHAGLTLKNAIMLHLSAQGYTVDDHGTNSAASCDYPVFAKRCCQAVLQQQEPGILICGTGIGMSIAANRIPGIRAALCTCEFHARACREHNNANVLCLGERVTGVGVAFGLVDIFLHTPFAGDRHQRRVDMLDIMNEDH